MLKSSVSIFWVERKQFACAKFLYMQIYQKSQAMGALAYLAKYGKLY
jgi:hypothetical protein